ncbi:UNVERIFIED_CONTAM: hypothetical protein RMT77_005772 [Armadillidium vulgare]
MESFEIRSLFNFCFIECEPPQLNVPDELVLRIPPYNRMNTDFEKFELTCSADKPVQWSTEVDSEYLHYNTVQNDSGFYSTIMFTQANSVVTGYFNCSYVGEEGGESKSTYIYVDAEISLRKPLIENHNRSVYLVGEEITLNCSTHMSEKYKPHFEWTLPNINAIRELKEFTNKSLSISTLLIKYASLSDSGQYVCTISVLNLFESNVKNIEVKENIIQFVKFMDKNDSMVHKKIVNDGDDFLWDMQFEGYPRNLIYTFYNPYGNLFLHKDKRANASYVYEEGKLSLSIKRVTVEDFGNYSVR